MPSAATARRAAMLPSSDIGNVTAEAQWKDGRGALLQLALDSNGTYSNKPFRVRVGGRVSTSTNTTFQVRVYFGLGAISANTLIFDSGPNSVNNSTSSWELWLDCFWSADAKQITGRGEGQIANNNVLGPSTLTNTPVSADPARDSNSFLQSGGTYGFTLTGLFGGSSSGNHAIADTFDLETV